MVNGEKKSNLKGFANRARDFVQIVAGPQKPCRGVAALR
jgi:hypothetical protein